MAIDKSFVEKYQDIVQHLIKNGANVNKPGDKGITPLMHAINKSRLSDPWQIKLVTLLLKNGAVLEAKDVFGKTALEYAREEKNTKAIKLLEQYTKKVQAPLSLPEQIITLNNLNSILGSLTNKR